MTQTQFNLTVSRLFKNLEARTRAEVRQFWREEYGMTHVGTYTVPAHFRPARGAKLPKDKIKPFTRLFALGAQMTAPLHRPGSKAAQKAAKRTVMRALGAAGSQLLGTLPEDASSVAVLSAMRNTRRSVQSAKRQIH